MKKILLLIIILMIGFGGYILYDKYFNNRGNGKPSLQYRDGFRIYAFSPVFASNSATVMLALLAASATVRIPSFTREIIASRKPLPRR